MNNLEMSKYLDANEAASYLKISVNTLYKLKRRYMISYIKPNGGKLYFLQKDLDAYMMANHYAMVS